MSFFRGLSRAVLVLAFIACGLQARAERVTIVVGKGAPPLEQLAATELADLLKRLFKAESQIAAAEDKAAEKIILLGSPETNPALRQAVGKAWPKLSQQGHLLRSLPPAGKDKRTRLIVGGASPVATLWAAYELGHHFGMRYLPSGDVMPAKSSELKLTGLDQVWEPTIRLRTWQVFDGAGVGYQSWPLAEQQRLIGQLAKLKFNRVLIFAQPWQPLVAYESQDIKKQTAVLLRGERVSVAGDTPGRSAFRGAAEFGNPDLRADASADERTAAGIALARGIFDAAHEHGMSAALAISPWQFPPEFAPLLDLDSAGADAALSVAAGGQQSPYDVRFTKLAIAQFSAYLRTYPQVDSICLRLDALPDWSAHYETSLKGLQSQKGVTEPGAAGEPADETPQRLAARQSQVVALDLVSRSLDCYELPGRSKPTPRVSLTGLDRSLHALAKQAIPSLEGVVQSSLEPPAPSGKAKVPESLQVALTQETLGVLPQVDLAFLQTQVEQARAQGAEGIVCTAAIAGDVDPGAYYLARAAFDSTLTAQAACDSLVTAMCGEGVTERVQKALDQIAEASALLAATDPEFARPAPNMLLKHSGSDPAPAAWAKAADLYLQGLNEMARADDRSVLSGRPLLRYYVKRCEFALGYLAAVGAVRQAGIARAAQDGEKESEQLAVAVESMYDALTALADQNRDFSDRAVIALVNQYAYRPLLAELERADAEGE